MANDILIVDDEDDIRLLMAGILQDEGYVTREAASGRDALAAIAGRRPTLVVLDIWMREGDHDGLTTLRIIKREHPELPVVMISGHGTIETAVEAIREGAYDFIEKPFKADRLLLVVRRAIEDARLRRENRELTLRAGGAVELVGKSALSNGLRQSVDRVARTNSRVLISGPAGAGKEVVARLIHGQSARHDGPFVVVNCASMRPDTLEQELFGCEPANGAPSTHGLLEQAHGGTLLLDEVADMPMETQGKIVRVLQDQTFQRVGGGAQVEVDVRVVAATNRDLSGAIVQQQFREDLFYRLNVVPIRVPALKERREDIPVLTRHFLDRTAEASGLARRDISAEAMAALQTYDWPGNVRQLRNIVERLLIMAPEENATPIRPEALPPELFAETPESFRFDRTSEIMGLPLRDAREVFEREYLAAQVSRFGGNISRTASFVGMERSALHRKLKSLGIAAERSAGA